jgi:hypothetical protein
MDGDRFDDLARGLSAAPSRRALLKGLAGGALAAALAALGAEGAGAGHFGCRHVGKPCARNGQCCSGRCRGPAGRETCRAHHQGGCLASQDQCTAGAGLVCGGGPCFCGRTTGGANVCWEPGTGACVACTTDRQCDRVLSAVGTACITNADAATCGCPTVTACVRPCPAL